MTGPTGKAQPLLDRDEDGNLLIWPENWDAVCAWSRVHDQWLRAGMDGRIVGFNLSSAIGIVEMMAKEEARIGRRIVKMELVDKIRFIANEVMGHLLQLSAKGSG